MITKKMDVALKSMDIEQITDMMEKFETQFEDQTVRGKVIEDAMQRSVSTMTPGEEVDALMRKVADENGMQWPL